MRRSTTAALMLAAALAGALVAGPLDPPAGPVAPSYKTLTEVEPRIAITQASTPGDVNSVFRITQPGSYYLTANLSGVSGKHGIEVAADGVTIDLKGFALTGGPGSLDGITVDGVRAQIRVHGGSVGGWGDDGIDLSPTGSGEACSVEAVSASGNADCGIVAPGQSSVRDCQVANCLGSLQSAAIRAGADSRVENCVVRNNSRHGIETSIGSTIIGCVASYSGGTGIATVGACIVSDCTAIDNAIGIEAASSGLLERVVANGNLTFGIVGGSVIIRNSTASGNDACGIQLSGGAVSGCTANGNQESGIRVSSGIVESCVASSNFLHGIQGSSECVIRGNKCSDNGFGTSAGAGCYVGSIENRVYDNTCGGNDIGVWVEGTSNLVYNNACRGNSGGNYSIVAGNRVAAIVVAPVSGVISGNSGAAGFGSTDPWANLAY